jgi:soluble lytic murein transglycosylase-like protein
MRRRLLQAATAGVLLVATLAHDTPRAAAIGLPDLPASSPPILYSQPDYTDLMLADAAYNTASALAAEWADYDTRVAAWTAAERLVLADAHTARLETIAAGSWHRLTPELLEMVLAAADAHGIDARKLARIVVCESGGNPNAHNPSGASGLTQQMPQFWPGRAAAAGLPGASVYDPTANLEVAAMMLARSDSPWDSSRTCWRG